MVQVGLDINWVLLFPRNNVPAVEEFSTPNNMRAIPVSVVVGTLSVYVGGLCNSAPLFNTLSSALKTIVVLAAGKPRRTTIIYVYVLRVGLCASTTSMQKTTFNPLECKLSEKSIFPDSLKFRAHTVIRGEYNSV